MPIGKDKPTRRIDKPAAYRGGGAVEASAADFAPPAIKSIPVPDDLVLDSFLGRSAATPTTYITAAWSRPSGNTPQSYVIQISENSGFPDGQTTTYTTATESATLPDLKPNVLYYVRVAAVFRSIQSGWSDVVSKTTPNDTTPAAQPTGLAGAWIGTGDLRITFTPPTSENYKDCEIKIYASSGGTLYHTEYNRGGSYIYPVALNIERNGGTGDPSLFVEARSRTYFNTINNTSVPTLTTTKAVPSAPTLSQSWSGDTGAAGADLKLSWTAVTDAAYYLLALNGLTAQRIAATVYTYTLAHNISDNTAADPTVTYSLKAVDGLGQQSSNVTGTATNVAPATTAVTVTAGFSAIAISATPSAAADLRDYTLRIIKDTVTLVTYRSSSPDVVYKATAAGSYQAGVKVNDQFGQASTETISSAVVLDALTIEELRSELSYTSDDGQSQADLNKLKDGDVTAAATAHAASASAWLTITAIRPTLDRYGQITLFTGGIAAGTLKVYIGLSTDGVTFTWFSGPLVATGATGQNTTFTAYGVEANAQTNAITLAATTAYRFDIPTITEARYIALKHRNTTGAYNLREYYPRRLLQTDDFQAESIRSINIGADQVLADHISVISLAAIVVDTGALNISGVLSIGASGGIYQGSGTFASPTTGLKLYNASGTGRLAGYNATVEQVALDTDGKLKAAAGKVYLDAAGVNVEITSSVFGDRSYRFVNSSGTLQASLQGTTTSADNTISLATESLTGKDATVQLVARAPSGKQSVAALDAASGANQARIAAYVTTAGTPTIDIGNNTAVVSIVAGLNMGSATGAAAGDINLSGGLNLGTATGAPDGGIAGTVNDAGTNTVTANLTLGHNTSGSPITAGFGLDIGMNLESTTTVDTQAALIRTSWATPTGGSQKARVIHYVFDTTAREGMRIEASGSAPLIGFLGATAVARQSIGAAAAAGGTGATAGAYDTAAHRDAAIALLNNIRAALINLGLAV
jgi:hypothetical protein